MVFKVISYLIESLVIMWGFAVFFTIIFQCKPIKYFWDKSITRGTCINLIAFGQANSISNFLIDVSILVLPLPIIWKLRLPLRRKFEVMGIFLFGSM